MTNRIQLLSGDITQTDVDAIVNAANRSLMGGGGVDGAIHRAGGQAILTECEKIRNLQGGCPTGEAVITGAGRLPARYVIHAVGPVWRGGEQNEEALLKSTYQHCFLLAQQYGIKTLAFPNISTGVYRFPKPLAAAIALEETEAALTANPALECVKFLCFDDENYHIYKTLLGRKREAR